MKGQQNIAILLPCYNEEKTIKNVADGFRDLLPSAHIYVYDNNSTDDTFNVAISSGATVKKEPLQGKGNVVRRMFADIEADLYILCDGDGTYDISNVSILISELVDNKLDMVNGSRVASDNPSPYPHGHQFGNLLFSKVIAWLFGKKFTDVLTGYRVFSKRFVKSFPALSSGFEIESELTIHALELRVPSSEVETNYRSRPPGSESKLHTFSDGVKILLTIFLLLKEARPLLFFTCISIVLASASILLAWPLIPTYLGTGLVPRFPTAILATGLMILSCVTLTSGIILDSVTRGRREVKRMFYLSIN